MWNRTRMQHHTHTHTQKKKVVVLASLFYLLRACSSSQAAGERTKKSTAGHQTFRSRDSRRKIFEWLIPPVRRFSICHLWTRARSLLLPATCLEVRRWYAADGKTWHLVDIRAFPDMRAQVYDTVRLRPTMWASFLRPAKVLGVGWNGEQCNINYTTSTGGR